jgi:pimeloyl-ACP methyl ester carboxylesterase
LDRRWYFLMANAPWTVKSHRHGWTVAIAYVVGHPERVSHLVLFGSYLQGLRKRAKSQDELELVEAYIDVIRLGCEVTARRCPGAG